MHPLVVESVCLRYSGRVRHVSDLRRNPVSANWLALGRNDLSAIDNLNWILIRTSDHAYRQGVHLLRLVLGDRSSHHNSGVNMSSLWLVDRLNCL